MAKKNRGTGRPNKDEDPRTKGTKSRPRFLNESDAIIIKATASSSYVDILKNVKEGVDLGEAGVEVTAVWKTRTGDLLIQVGNGKDEGVRLRAEVEKKLPQLGEIRNLSKRLGCGGNSNGANRRNQMSNR